MSHDILTLYSAKAIEYAIAVGFLLLFVPFWRYVNTDLHPAAQPALAGVRRRATELVEWFRMARDVAFHPGHAWARAAAPGVMLVGMDDFAQKLVGPTVSLELPAPGARLSQGDPAWRLTIGDRSVDMLSPVDGTVLAVNQDVASRPQLLNEDPYGAGWLLKVDAPRAEANLTSLLSGRLAKTWLREATDALRWRMSPDLGLVLQDGGVPVDGIAHALDAEHWDEVARQFFLS
jgi:glycine cleavage system H protein